MASESAPPAPGAKKPVRIGKYEVVQHIATGGMGAVYRARDPQTKQEVALKILPPDKTEKQALVVRFKREYAAASKLRHENIVALYEFGESGNALWFAMEFVDGIDLHEHIQKQGTVDPEEARSIVLQAARALRHANAHGIVHRDIKPSNFLLARKNGKLVVKLTDFGLAREEATDQFRVTRAGTTVGTIDYMSPEQAKDSGAADIRSDLYSLGSTWYHLLVGHSPFPHGGLGERLIKIMNEIPTDARELNPQVSGETWAVVEKLLAKSPADRYQTPEELIDDLLPLEGKATAKPKSKPAAKKRKKPKTASETKAGQETRADAPPAGSGTYLALATTAAVMLLAVALFFFWPRKPREEEKKEPPPVAATDDKGTDKGGEEKDRPKEKGPVKPPPVVEAKLPALHRHPAKEALAKLRAECEKPWAGQAAPSGKAARVRRVPGPGEFRSLAEAAASGAEIIEIHDNGPLFELPASSAKALTVRAGRGYRPLVVWDLLATQERRRAERRLDEPLVFLSSKGELRLEGMEVAWRWPESIGEPAAVLSAEGGLRVEGCTLSGAGKPRDSLFLARVKGGEGTRVRLDRVFSRGQKLSGLDIDAPGAEILLDGCLVSGQGPMVRLRSKDRPSSRLRFVRSTVSVSGTMVELLPAKGDPGAGLSVLAWDSLLARSAGEGPLLRLGEGAGPGTVEWKGVNALYAGWGILLESAPRSVRTLEDWRKQWASSEGDGLHRDAWPELAADEPGAQPASDFQPGEALAFGATVDPDRPLGCDLAALPPSRDGWLRLAFDPTLPAVEALTDASPPDIPAPGDGLFHGATLDPNETDVGAFLAGRKLGPRVVMRLVGKGTAKSSPIQVKGSSLVLHFEQPEGKDSKPLALVAGFTPDLAPLVSVEGGDLEVIGGVLRSPDSSGVKLPWLVRVKGGDVRMHKTRLDGPRQAVPEGYRGVLRVHGSGDADRPATVALNECVVVSSLEAVSLADSGMRFHLKQSVLVAGTDALSLLPGKGKAGMGVSLEYCTLAARRAMVRLGDLPEGGVPPMPVQVRSKDCAFLNPFPGKGAKSGMLLFDGEGFHHGLLAWQSERDGYDPRLHFAAAALPISEGKAAKDAWGRLLGTPGFLSPRPPLPGTLRVFDAKAWDLDRLGLPMRELGADLSRLGLTKKK
ncbi:MAG: protein kinase [Gemmataceae bacterium]|nr:protein kinase [Gemmataceae bacterium]